MNIRIEGVKKKLIKEAISISGSKSESNRLLILQKLFPEISIENVSDSDDTHHLKHALTTSDSEINVGHAGTAMRFLTAFFCYAKEQNNCSVWFRSNAQSSNSNSGRGPERFGS